MSNGIKVKTELEIDWRRLGANFAHMTDEQQADFFSGLAKETIIFSEQCDWFHQFSCVGDRMSRGAKRRLLNLFESMDLEASDD